VAPRTRECEWVGCDRAEEVSICAQIRGLVKDAEEGCLRSCACAGLVQSDCVNEIWSICYREFILPMKK